MSRLINSNTLGGLALLAFGAIYLGMGADYTMGTAQRMGAGYFPMLVGWLIVGVGVLIVLRGFLQGGIKGAIAWRPLAAISASIAAFGIAMPLFGLAPAVMASVVLSATAETPIVPTRVAILSAFLILLGYLVFVVTLGMPMPLVRLP